MLAKILASLFVVMLILGAVAFASGWIQFQDGNKSTTIELKTEEMKDAADNVIDKGKELIDRASGKNTNSGESDDHNEADPGVGSINERAD